MLVRLTKRTRGNHKFVAEKLTKTYQAMQQSRGLNDVQLSLLRLFNRPMSYEESVEIRDLLSKHYAEKLFDEVDKVVAEKIITEADYEKLRNQHQRTQL